MDSIVWIAAAMSAIVFTWVGYFLGNFFPFLRQKSSLETQYQRGSFDTQYQKGIRKTGFDFELVKKLFSRIRDWLLERDISAEQTTQSEAEFSEKRAEDEAVQAAESGQPWEESGLSITRGKESILVWQDQTTKKLFAEVDGHSLDLNQPLALEHQNQIVFLLLDMQNKIGFSSIPRGEGTILVWQEQAKDLFFTEIDGLQFDLNKPLSPEHHNKLSFLLVDLQEKVGVSATIQSQIARDVQKLEEKPDSIPKQINAILQDLLEGTPLDDKGILVSELPGRGVVFIVGIKTYDAIENIPDSEIRLVIRQAVKQWEEQQEED